MINYMCFKTMRLSNRMALFIDVGVIRVDVVQMFK